MKRMNLSLKVVLHLKLLLVLTFSAILATAIVLRAFAAARPRGRYSGIPLGVAVSLTLGRCGHGFNAVRPPLVYSNQRTQPQELFVCRTLRVTDSPSR